MPDSHCPEPGESSRITALLPSPSDNERALYGASHTYSRAIRKLRKRPVHSILELMRERIGKGVSPDHVNGWLYIVRYWGRKAQPVTDLILNLSKHREHRIRESAVDLLGRLELKTPKIERALNEATKDVHPGVACRARQSLRKLNLL